MTVTPDEFRSAILGDGMDGWQPLAVAAHAAPPYFPLMADGEREAMVADQFRGLLSDGLIAVASRPEPGRRPIPMSPALGYEAIDAPGWRHEPFDAGVGYVTTQPGVAIYESADLCWPCDGYVSRLATSRIDFAEGPVTGLVPVCDDHREIAGWPKGAAAGIAEGMAEARGIAWRSPDHPHHL